MNAKQLLLQGNILWKTFKFVAEHLDELNIEGVSDMTIEKKFYQDIYETIESIAPDASYALEEILLSVSNKGREAYIDLEIMNKDSSKGSIKSKITTTRDDLPDKVRESILLKGYYTQKISFKEEQLNETK